GPRGLRARAVRHEPPAAAAVAAGAPAAGGDLMSAAYLFSEPTARPLTPSGAIMPSAKLTFYESGTTTLATIYADAELTTPLANPLDADASGRFVPIYLHPLTTYRVLLNDADDVLVYDVDPYALPRDYPPGTVMFF